MRIYHGSSYQDALERCRQVAPSHNHGFCWIPSKMTAIDEPYILDNGAFSAFANGVPWDPDGFVRRLGELDRMPREPDFVILPDVVANPEMTKERSRKWASIINHRTAVACQDGHGPDEMVEFAAEVDAEVLFIGGTSRWKRRHAAKFVTAAHQRGLDAHIGRPNDLTWARDTGADSVDTTTIVTGSWHKLRDLEQNSSLTRFAATDGGSNKD